MKFWVSGAEIVHGNDCYCVRGHNFGNSWNSSRCESPSCSWPHSWSCHLTAKPPGEREVSPSANRVIQVCQQQSPLNQASSNQKERRVFMNRSGYRKQQLPQNTHQLRISEDALMASRKWIKVSLGSITSPVSKLALRHALQ